MVLWYQYISVELSQKRDLQILEMPHHLAEELGNARGANMIFWELSAKNCCGWWKSPGTL